MKNLQAVTVQYVGEKGTANMKTMFVTPDKMIALLRPNLKEQKNAMSYLEMYIFVKVNCLEVNKDIPVTIQKWSHAHL